VSRDRRGVKVVLTVCLCLGFVDVAHAQDDDARRRCAGGMFLATAATSALAAAQTDQSDVAVATWIGAGVTAATGLGLSIRGRGELDDHARWVRRRCLGGFALGLGSSLALLVTGFFLKSTRTRGIEAFAQLIVAILLIVPAAGFLALGVGLRLGARDEPESSMMTSPLTLSF